MSEILFRHVFETVYFLKVGKDNGETKTATIVAMAKNSTENFRKIVETEIMSVVATETMIEMIEITSLEIGTMTEIMIEATGITEVVFLVTNLATILTAIQEENFKTRTLTISFVTLFLSKIASSCLEIFQFFVKPSSSRESKNFLQSDLG